MSLKTSLYALFLLFLSLELFAQNTLVVQPDPACAKEAMIWQLDTQQGPFGTTNVNNYSGLIYWPIMNWTWNGSPGQRYVLFDFLDGIVIPDDVAITNARLSLFAPDEPTSDQFHSLEVNTGKPSIGVIQGITEAWDLSTVTWNNQPATTDEDEIVLAAPSTEQENYPDIDVTALIQQQVAQAGERHGLLMKMQATDFYRKLIFAGSRYENPDLRPRLTIEYTGTVINTDPPTFDLITAEELELCPGETLEISANNPEQIDQFLWSTGETTASITVSEAGNYSLLAMVGACFELQDDIEVVLTECSEPIDCEVFYPDIFSPNQDGANDEFRLFYASECVLSNYRMEVYNRWGQQVFLSENPVQGWKGEFKGKLVPAGVYIYQTWYQLPGAAEITQHSGQVTLIR